MKAITAVLTIAALSTQASAITWNTYSTYLPGTTLDQRPELAGQVVASQDILIPADATHPWVPTVTLHNYVVRENATGTLDFYVQLINNSTTTQSVVQLGLSGFDTGPSLDVDQLTMSGGVPIGFAAHGTSTIYFGSTARGSGMFSLLPGQSTWPMFVHTDAIDFDTTGAFTFLQLGYTIPQQTYAPAASFGATAVPEPLSLPLLVLAVAGIMFRTRCRA